MSVWDQHADFLAKEAATLAITDQSESAGLLSLMQKAYDLALREAETKYGYLANKIEIEDGSALQSYRFKKDPLPEDGLYSKALKTYTELLFSSPSSDQHSEQSPDDVEQLFDTFCKKKNGWHSSLSSQFEIQRFSREEIDRWLRLCGVKSQYLFLVAPVVQPELVMLNKCHQDCWVTHTKLLTAFEDWGLRNEWFRYLNSHEWLKKSRMQLGVGGRKSVQALYCPYSVMLGLTKDIKGREKGEMLQFNQGKRILRNYFPGSYDKHIPEFMED